MIPQTVDFIFSVCTFKSFHTIVLYENACCYTKLLETFGKTGDAFVNQPLLFLLKNWSYGYQIEVKQEHTTLLIILSGLETSEWQPKPDFIPFSSFSPSEYVNTKRSKYGFMVAFFVL